MPRSRLAIERALESKGFRRVEGDHHYFVYERTSGERTPFRTKTSHSPKMKEVPNGLLGQMAKQVGLVTKDFLSLVDCPLSREEYERKLVEAGKLTPSEDAGDQ